MQRIPHRPRQAVGETKAESKEAMSISEMSKDQAAKILQPFVGTASYNYDALHTAIAEGLDKAFDEGFASADSEAFAEKVMKLARDKQ
jgi:hypothetical protein